MIQQTGFLDLALQSKYRLTGREAFLAEVERMLRLYFI
jgi:hypothetical protein